MSIVGALSLVLWSRRGKGKKGEREVTHGVYGGMVPMRVLDSFGEEGEAGGKCE